MDKKLILVTILFAIFASVVARNDLILGQNRTSHVLIYQQFHNITGIPGQIVSRNYFFQSPFRNITQFRALDQDLFGLGGFASVIQGGIGLYNITYNLRASAFGRGFNFIVDMYGV